MSTALQIAMAAGVLLSLVLHMIGKKHPTAEKAAEVVDEAEDMAKRA